METVPLEFYQRDLLLMPFPYSDLSGSKVRPVVVVSNDQFNQHSLDLIVCCVTSNISKDFYTVFLPKDGLQAGKLLDDCCVKVENIAKIEKSKVVKKIGIIHPTIFKEVMQKITSLFEN